MPAMGLGYHSSRFLPSFSLLAIGTYLMDSTNSPAAQPTMPGMATLPSTLAQRIQFFRQIRGWTPQQLADKIQVPLTQIEDIESGIDVFLSSILRRKLAQALRMHPQWLKDVEVEPESISDALKALQAEPTPDKIMTEERLMAIRDNPDHTWPCPYCDAPLSLQFFDRLDMDENPVLSLKINCSRCLFRHTAEWIEWVHQPKRSRKEDY